MARRSLALASLVFLLPVQSQVPPQAAEVLKKVGTQLAEKLLKPKMKVESFYLGGFKATQVDPDGEATAEKFSGTATFELPAPLGSRKLAFKGLVLKGTTAEGTLDEALKEVTGDLHGWKCRITRIVLSDKGSHVEGNAALQGIKVDLAPLTLSSKGLTGTLSPGDLPLAEGPFTAKILNGEVDFRPSNVMLKGPLEITLASPVRHGETGAPVTLGCGAITFDSALLSGTGSLGGNLAKGHPLPLLHNGHTWVLDSVAFAFEEGRPLLRGPVHLRFPLHVFCQAGATDKPYLTEPLDGIIHGFAATPKELVAARPTAAAVAGPWPGFGGDFPLPAATLNPSGLTAYRLRLERGIVRVQKGQIQAQGTKLTGTLNWGVGDSCEVRFVDASAGLEDGLYVLGQRSRKLGDVGAYRINYASSGIVCDFNSEVSPGGLPEGWMGVYLPSYFLQLPEELFTLGPGTATRTGVLVNSKAGRFEGNGSFSGAVAVQLPTTQQVLLHIAPVQLDPFELRFVEGALLHGPEVTGKLNLTDVWIFEDFSPAIRMKLTQNGVEQIEIDTRGKGSMGLPTSLVGVAIVVDSAVLNPTNLDFTGRFDFAIAGAALPSIPFDHLVLEASGGGIDAAPGGMGISYAFKGQRWAGMPGRPHVSLWGYPFCLAEAGYGVLSDQRFFVGLGGDFEINPLLPTFYNRMWFTTDPKDAHKGTIELERQFGVHQDLASMGRLDGDLTFEVAAAGDEVSDAGFHGKGRLGLALGDGAFTLDTGMRFGRHHQGNGFFPYFYALGCVQSNEAAINVAPNLQVYGFLGGLAQNFVPDEIRDMENISGRPDGSTGLAVMAGVKVGSADQFTFHGDLDFYLSQNLTTLLQGRGWLFCTRDQEPSDNEVTADVRLARNPTTFDATFGANLNLYHGLFRAVGEVALHFGPDKQFLHVGTKEAPITVSLKSAWDAMGYMTADFEGGGAALGAGAAFSYRKDADFGIIWGNAYLNARGDLLIEIDGDKNPHFLGTLAAEGGASFGMRFATFWKTYKVTIFSGSIGTNLAFQIPGSPTLSGAVTIRYRVLGGLFKGSVSAHMDM